MNYNKIVLVEPKITAPRIDGFSEIAEPIGLCYIKSYLKKRGYNVKIIQQAFKTDKETIDLILKENPDAVGFTMTTNMYNRVKRFSKILKDRNIFTIVGGAHPTNSPESCVKHFDYIIIGEGEETTLELLNNLNLNKKTNKIKGIAYYDCKIKKTIINPRRKRLNFDKQELPDREDLDMTIYKKTFAFYPFPTDIKNLGTILGSKGCPYNCSFCSNNSQWKRQVTSRSAKNIFKEIRLLYKKYNVNYIWFQDETFTLNKEKVIELCDKIIKSGMKIYFGCMSRINMIDKELLGIMKKAGWHHISYGIESGDQKTLNKMDKMIDLKNAKKVIKMTLDNGIIPRAFYIIGTQHDTIKSLEKTKKYAIELDTLFSRFGYLYPFLGTKDREYIDKNKLWIESPTNLNLVHCLKPVVKSKVSKEYLIKFRTDVLKNIYTSKEYQERKNKFLQKYPEYKESYKKWKEYNYYINL